MLERDVAEGIHRVQDAHTNWYLVQDGTRLTVVDTGLPRSWGSLQSALRELGRSPSDIEAVVLTHAHFDHMGFARRAQQELSVELWAHEREVPVVQHPWRYDHARSRILYLRHPEFVRVFSEMTAMGAPWVKGTDTVRTYASSGRLDVPGTPEIVFTPGHTYGHCSLLFGDRGAVIVGDAFVMLDPYTGRHGPCVVAGAATADSGQALSSRRPRRASTAAPHSPGTALRGGAPWPRPPSGPGPRGRHRLGRRRGADRAPSVEARSREPGAPVGSGSGAPAAPAGDRLRLLPSGPDLVHGPTPRGTRAIDASRGGAARGLQPLGRGFSPARADCRFRAPLPPRLARSASDPSGRPQAEGTRLGPRAEAKPPRGLARAIESSVAPGA